MILWLPFVTSQTAFVVVPDNKEEVPVGNLAFNFLNLL